MMCSSSPSRYLLFVVLVLLCASGPLAAQQRLKPSTDNPFYWEYKGEAVILLGGSKEDNLFQVEEVEHHLDEISATGANYVRCVMSARDIGNVWWFERDSETGLYDLNRPGSVYFERFENFLRMAEKRGIIVQIELWDRFDFARDPWLSNPYNPKNNINYTAAESGLEEVYERHPWRRDNRFFRSVPSLEDNGTILAFQQVQMDAILSVSLGFGNVLYCIDNETNESPEWGAYWSRYLQARAREAGVSAMITEMWDAHELWRPQHFATIEHPELYDFIEISQNNHNNGRLHWDHVQHVRNRLIADRTVRPLNNVKIYGATGSRYGDKQDAQDRFWLNILGGAASARFHRPPSGLGLNDQAKANIRSMRMALSRHDVLRAQPLLDILHGQAGNEKAAYCSAIPGESYLLYLPAGGTISLSMPRDSKSNHSYQIQWLDIGESTWQASKATLEIKEGLAVVDAPDEQRAWAAVIERAAPSPGDSGDR